MKSFLITALSLVSTTALAHPGHLPGEAVHGFLHAEHLMLIAGIGAVALVVYLLRNR